MAVRWGMDEGTPQSIVPTLFDALDFYLVAGSSCRRRCVAARIQSSKAGRGSYFERNPLIELDAAAHSLRHA